MAEIVKNHGVLEIKDLEKSYMEGNDSRNILKGVNLNVKKGEIILIIGRSGSGKSSLLNIISGIDKADKGLVSIAGKNLSKLSEKELTGFRRKNIGFVFQFFNLVPTLTTRENLMLPLSLNNLEDNGKIKSFLKELSLEDKEKSFPDTLSGGEQQRVAIARALIHDPEIILADEPTGNLDEKTGNRVISLFEKLVRENNKTLILVTHNLALRGIADRVFTIKDRKLEEDGELK